MEHRHIVIFDGVCNFCNGAVNFIIKRNPDGVFVFTPMQSQLAKQLTQQYGMDNVSNDTFLLIKQGQCFSFSDAALEITQDLTGGWFVLRVFKLLPRAFRDYFYRLFARHRYQLFGKQATCMLPTEHVKSRFIGIDENH